MMPTAHSTASSPEPDVDGNGEHDVADAIRIARNAGWLT